MPHVIILGDVHLGKGINIGKTNVAGSLNSRVADQLSLLDWTLEQAIERDVDDIVITGDVFEEPKPHPSQIAALIAWLKKCQAYEKNIHIILGNHDMLRNGIVFTSSLDIVIEMDLENVTVYKDVNTIFIGTTAFTMMPFRDRKSFICNSNADAVRILHESLVYELAGIPATYKKVLVGHLAIEGSIPVGDEIDDIANELFCPVDMFTGYDYVWMGHVHKPQVMKKGKPYIAHVGSMDISNFGETDQKKHLILVDCDSSVEAFEKIDLPTRPLKKIVITVPKDTEDPTAYVLEQIKNEEKEFNKSIVKVEIALASPDLKSVNKSSVEKYLTDQGAFNVTNISESKKVALVKKDGSSSIDTKMDVTSCIKEFGKIHVEDLKRDAYIEESLDILNTLKSEAKE